MNFDDGRIDSIDSVSYKPSNDTLILCQGVQRIVIQSYYKSKMRWLFQLLI